MPYQEKVGEAGGRAAGDDSLLGYVFERRRRIISSRSRMSMTRSLFGKLSPASISITRWLRRLLVLWLIRLWVLRRTSWAREVMEHVVHVDLILYGRRFMSGRDMT